MFILEALGCALLVALTPPAVWRLMTWWERRKGKPEPIAAPPTRDEVDTATKSALASMHRTCRVADHHCR